MQDFTQKQFSITYTINGGKVRSGASGEFENAEKEVIKYGAKVLISTENTYDVYNSQTDCLDTEEDTLIFRIDSTSNVSAGILVKKLKEFFKLGGVLNFNAGAAKYDARTKLSYVRASEDADTFINIIEAETKKLKGGSK